MSEWLTVERSINRDNQGNCLPEVIEVLGITLDDESHPKIKVDPLTRSEFLQLSKGGETGKLEDIEIIKQHCLQPKYVDADFDRMSLRSINALVFAIIEASTGIPQAQLRETRVSMIASAQEELLKKKAESFKLRRLEYFLHELGYTYFDMGRLTYLEINRLVNEHNQKQSDAERASRKKNRW